MYSLKQLKALKDLRDFTGGEAFRLMAEHEQSQFDLELSDGTGKEYFDAARALADEALALFHAEGKISEQIHTRYVRSAKRYKALAERAGTTAAFTYRLTEEKVAALGNAGLIEGIEPRGQERTRE